MNVILRILGEIALGMHYLHSRKPQVIHRDLKSLNILVYFPLQFSNKTVGQQFNSKDQ